MKPIRNVWQLAVGVGLIYLLLAMPSGIYAQQNIQFGQYIFNGLAVNPAYAGYKEAWYINGTYRDQWTGFIGSPKTAVVSVDGSFWERNRLGVGFQLINDRLGAQNNTGGTASFAYRISLDEADSRRLCFGISAGIYNYRIDRNKLNPLDPYDQELEQLKSITNPDAGLGVYYSTPKLYAGLSALNLISRHEKVLTTIKRAPHLYLTSGILFNVSDRVKLKPSILVKEDFKGPTNMDFNAFILFNDRIWLGGSYRTRVSFWDKDHLQPDLTYLDAWSAIIDFFVTEQLRIGYAYDYTLTEIANYEHGSHEISIGYTFKRKEQIIISPRYF